LILLEAAFAEIHYLFPFSGVLRAGDLTPLRRELMFSPMKKSMNR